MSRIARAVAVGVPHHINQRGNNHQDVFFVEEDRAAYLRLLKSHAERFDLTVYGYCLMTNHVHLIVVPHNEQALSKAIGRTHYDFTRYINRMHARSGHFWQNRFYSCPLDDERYWSAMCYIERSPVRAKMVRRAWRYAWSSAGAHVTGHDTAEVLDLSEWRRKKEREDWANQLAEPQDDETVSRIRSSLRTGRPCGSDSFVRKVERLLGRRLRATQVGRPPSKKNKRAGGTNG